jgi:Cu/Zn superoxide dismutase
VRRITKAALGGVAGCALVLGGTQAASGALSTILKIHEESGDFSTLTAQPLDSAKAKITIAEGTSSTGKSITTFSVRLTGIDPTTTEGKKLGAHLHMGECVEGDSVPRPGSRAGPHYNDEVATEGKVLPTTALPDPPNAAVVSSDTEVWFEFVADAEGMAYDETTVNFTPDDSDPAWVPGVMSVVVHVRETNTAHNVPFYGAIVGDAGARQACFPLAVPDHWAD